MPRLPNKDEQIPTKGIFRRQNQMKSLIVSISLRDDPDQSNLKPVLPKIVENQESKFSKIILENSRIFHKKDMRNFEGITDPNHTTSQNQD